MLAHFKNPKERDDCIKHLARTYVEKNNMVFVAMFGPYISSPVTLATVSKDGAEYTGVMKEVTGIKGTGYYTKYVPKVKKLVEALKNNNVKIHGVLYWGHSAGPSLGDGWYHTKTFLTIMDFTKYILKPLQPKVVIFDSCYMGVVSALYEMTEVKSILYVLASPTYHPSHSCLNTRDFGKIGTGSHDKATLAKQLKKVTCSFQELVSPAYRCFIMIDLQKVHKLVEELQNLAYDKDTAFAFVKDTQLSKADPVTHDLYRSVKDSHVKTLIKEISKDTCGLNKCKVARGVSIEKEFPDAHRGLYKSMKWYKKMKHFYGE